MKSPRQTTSKVNTQKIKDLFKNSGKSFDELSDAIGGVSSRTLRRMAEEKDVRVSKTALDNVQKYFNININEISIPDDANISTNHVILHEIHSLSDLFENQFYKDLRANHGHENIRTFRNYDVTIDSDTSAPIQSLIKLALSKSSLLNSYGHEDADIQKEIEYIEKLKEGNDALEYLRTRGVYLYYGNYKFKGIEDRFLDKQNPRKATKEEKEIFNEINNSINSEEDISLYEGTEKLIPAEIKVEVFYFKGFLHNHNVPYKYKIFPNLGYTEKQMIDDYVSAMKKNNFKENKIEGLKEWAIGASKLNWYIKERKGLSNKYIWFGNYLPSDYYIDMSSENLGLFKFFKEDANSYNGNFEKVLDFPEIRKLHYDNYRGFLETFVYQDLDTIDSQVDEKEKEEPMK